MWICPVCNEENTEPTCSTCGYDGSLNLLQYATLGIPAKKGKALSKYRREWEEQLKTRLRCEGCGGWNFRIGVGEDIFFCTRCGREQEGKRLSAALAAAEEWSREKLHLEKRSEELKAGQEKLRQELDKMEKNNQLFQRSQERQAKEFDHVKNQLRDARRQLKVAETELERRITSEQDARFALEQAEKETENLRELLAKYQRGAYGGVELKKTDYEKPYSSPWYSAPHELNTSGKGETPGGFKMKPVIPPKDEPVLWGSGKPHMELLSGKIVNKKVVALGLMHTAVLLADGTVEVVGHQEDGLNVKDWHDVVSIEAGEHSVFAVRKDGTVFATGKNSFGEGNVTGWKDIVQVAAGFCHTLGLRGNGTVIATGYNPDKRCSVEAWTEVTAIACGREHSVGLRRNGTVCVSGSNRNCQCSVMGWSGITAVAAGDFHTVGLRSNGTVVATGWDSYGQCKVNSWKNVAAIAAGPACTIGVCKDGSVLVAGNIDKMREIRFWNQIESVDVSMIHCVGLKKDGTLIAAGDNQFGQCDVTKIQPSVT